MPEVADIHATSMVFGLLRLTRPGGHREVKKEGQTAVRVPSDQAPNSQEGHKVTSTVPNSHEGTGSVQGALSGYECAWKAKKCFALDLHRSYFFLPVNAIFGHFMPF